MDALFSVGFLFFYPNSTEWRNSACYKRAEQNKNALAVNIKFVLSFRIPLLETKILSTSATQISGLTT